MKPDLDRRQSVADMRARGLSYAQIGAALGVSRQRAYSMLRQWRRDQDMLLTPARRNGRK